MKTLRDEFALLRASQTAPLDASSFDGKLIMYEDWAKECYEAADAFMRARELPVDSGTLPPPEEPLYDGFEDEPPPSRAELSARFRTWPAHDPATLSFTDSDMLYLEGLAEECDTWLTKWKGVTPCRMCESMTLTPFGYKCTKCGGEDIPF